MKQTITLFITILFIVACDENEHITQKDYSNYAPYYYLEVSKGKYIDKIVLSWTESPRTDYYEVLRLDKTTNEYKLIAKVNETTYSDTTIRIPHEQYYYKIGAKKGDGIVTYYNNTNYGYLHPFDAVTNFYVPYRSFDHILLTWDSILGAEKYLLYRSKSLSEKFKLIASMDTVNYIDTNIEKLQTYYYKLIASNSKIGTTPVAVTDSGYVLESYELVNTISERGSAAGQINDPYDIIYDESYYYISEKGNKRISVFNKDWSFNRILFESDVPRGMHWLENGNILVAMSGEEQLSEIDLNGNIINEYPLKTTWDNAYLREIDVDKDGNLYAFSPTNLLIQKLSPNGDSLTSWIPVPEGYSTSTLSPFEIYNDYIITGYETIHYYSLNGLYIKSIPCKKLLGRNGVISYIASDKKNNLYFSIGNEVRIVNAEGTVSGILGRLVEPRGITVNDDGQIIVLDKSQDKIFVFEKR